MPDSTRNDADDGFHEIQLSGKQLVFLFMATTVVAVVIFLCGVQVGRNVRTDRSTDSADALATAAAAPAPAQVPPSLSTATPPAEAPPPAQDTDEHLSYAKRLQSTKAPKEQLNAQPTAAAVSASAVPPQPKTPNADTGREPRRSAEGAKAGNWVVQVHALKDRSAAEGIAQRLISKGYPAFVLDPDPGAPTIYRVQVGRYVDRREAEQVARKLEKDEQYKPIIHSAR